MSAIIPGFEYDIFISYRQKDNKYDGWVTDFVNNLHNACVRPEWCKNTLTGSPDLFLTG